MVVPGVLNASPAAPPTAMEVQIRLVLLCPYTGDWPGRGPHLTALQPAFSMGDEPDVYIYDADAFLDHPVYHPLGGQVLSTTAVSFTASSSMFYYESRPLAIQRSTATALPQKLYADGFAVK